MLYCSYFIHTVLYHSSFVHHATIDTICYYAMLCCAAPHHTTLHNTKPYYSIAHHAMLYCTTPRHATRQGVRKKKTNKKTQTFIYIFKSHYGPGVCYFTGSSSSLFAGCCKSLHGCIVENLERWKGEISRRVWCFDFAGYEALTKMAISFGLNATRTILISGQI